jgi:cobalt/nickel transport system permease protein
LTAIDKLAYKSKISGYKAGNKLIFACSIMILCLFFNSVLISVMTIVTMSAATLFWGGCRLKKYIRLLLIPLAFLTTGVITIIMNQITVSGAALVSFRLFGAVFGITADSLTNGLNILLKAFGAVTCLYFFSLNTPMNSFLSLLRKRTPGILVELMELIYRFVFIIWEEAGKIHTAQSSRLGYKGFMNSMNSLGELVTNVFIRAFRRVERVNISLESRGFDGNFEFLIEEEQSSRLMNGCTILAVAAFITTGILERLWK